MKGQEYVNYREGMALIIKVNNDCYILTKGINESSISNNEKNSIILAQITDEKDAGRKAKRRKKNLSNS